MLRLHSGEALKRVNSVNSVLLGTALVELPLAAHVTGGYVIPYEMYIVVSATTWGNTEALVTLAWVESGKVLRLEERTQAQLKHLYEPHPQPSVDTLAHYWGVDDGWMDRNIGPLVLYGVALPASAVLKDTEAPCGELAWKCTCRAGCPSCDPYEPVGAEEEALVARLLDEDEGGALPEHVRVALLARRLGELPHRVRERLTCSKHIAGSPCSAPWELTC
jgi:hypothetical protein